MSILDTKVAGSNLSIFHVFFFFIDGTYNYQLYRLFSIWKCLTKTATTILLSAISLPSINCCVSLFYHGTDIKIVIYVIILELKDDQQPR